MQTRHFATHPKHAFTMLLAIPAATGLVALGGGSVAASASPASGTTRSASGIAATAGSSRNAATAVTLATLRAVVVSPTTRPR